LLVQRGGYARSECLHHWWADCGNLSVIADPSWNTGYSAVSQNTTLIFGSEENRSTYIESWEEEEFAWVSCFREDALGLIALDLGEGASYTSLGIERRYALANNHFLTIQHCVRNPPTLNTPSLHDSRLKDLYAMGGFGRWDTSYKKDGLATIILARHR